MMTRRTTMWDDQTDHPRQDASRIQVMMDPVSPITLDDEMMVQWHQMQEMEIIIPDDPRIIHRFLEDLPELPDDIVATSLDLFPSLQPPDSCTPTTISPTDVTTPVYTAINVISLGFSSTANDDPPNPTINPPSTISILRADDDVDDGTPANTSPPIISSHVNKKATDHVRSSTRMKKKSCCNPSPKAKKSRTGKKANLLVKELASEGEVQVEAKEVRRASRAEHIRRERQRRDDMAAKYTLLETLLPPAPKRERAVVVEDTMLFVKNLQHRKEELLKKRAQLKLTILTQADLAPWGSSHSKKNCKPGVTTTTTTTTHGTGCKTGSPLSSFMDHMMKPVEIMKSTSLPGSGNYAPNLSNVTSCKDSIINPTTCNNYTSCVKTLRIHAGLPDEEIVIEMVCGRPPPNLHSLLIHMVELVCLELTNFSLHRISHELVQCKISGKSRLQHGMPDLQSSPMSKVAALQTALERI